MSLTDLPWQIPAAIVCYLVVAAILGRRWWRARRSERRHR